MNRNISILFLILINLLTITLSKPTFLVLTQDDLSPDEPISGQLSGDGYFSGESSGDGEFDGTNPTPDNALDSGSWRRILEPIDTESGDIDIERESGYYKGVKKMMEASELGDGESMEVAVMELEREAQNGCVDSQSVLGFVYGMGIGRERNKAKGFLYHHFAGEGESVYSKMAVAYTYYTQEMHEKAAKLYSELAETAMNSFLISKDAPAVELVRIHSGSAENTDTIRKYRGEEDEDFQILEYQAQKGNGGAMYKIGTYYYFGLRGVKRDYSTALLWITKAAQKGEPKAMELLGEMYVKGAGVQKNYTDAFQWLKLAANRKLYSAYNGMGYLYVKGYGVEERNYTRAKDYFESAALANEVGGVYNLGVMYLKGIGVKRNVKLAFKYFEQAAQVGHPKAFYQLAKMFHTGVGLKRNLIMATELYKLVAEQGPWSSLSRWALDSYLNGDVGKALFLYSRMAELGYEVAQSNAAWILDKYGENSMCMGESGLCTDDERYQRAHSLWWKASEQNNEHAALMIGDAYYYGWGTEIDYKSAADAYMRAKTHSNAQALFNLGYMHEHGQGLPLDLHLAKRYYDQALQSDPAARLPVTLALASLWIRKNYDNSFLVHVIDSLPQVFPRVEEWVENVLKEEGNATILTLFVCLLTVLYFRERHRRHAVPVVRDPAPPNQFNNHLAPLVVQ